MVLPQNQDETMMSKVEAKLNEMGVTIPDAPTPAANYLPFTQSGNLVFVSGQVPFVDGKLQVTGTVGADASLEDAQGQARDRTALRQSSCRDQPGTDQQTC